MIVSNEARYLWEWFHDLSESVLRVSDGVCRPIPPSEFLAWKEASGRIVYPSEYAILRAMDKAYCAGMNAELEAYREREKERRG